MARLVLWGRPRTMIGRVLLWHAVAVVGVLLVLGVVADRVLERYFVDQLTDSLVTDGRAVQQALPAGDLSEPVVVDLGRAIGIRITVIRTDGVVLADSEHDPATMENHRSRPEVIQALAGHVGVSSRPSATIGIPFRYVALPPSNGRIVRVALPLTTVHARLQTVRVILLFGFAAAALAGLAAMALIARSESRPLRRIAGAVAGIGEGATGPDVPEEGSEELVALARTVNRMRGEIGERISAVERERNARDAILSTLEEGVMLFDPDGSVIYQNESARRLFGPVDRVNQLSPGSLQQAVGQAAGTASAERREVRTGHGAPRTLDATAVPIPDDGRVLFVARDVTEARAVDEVRRDFVANASHELKTPVASLQALAETILAASTDDPEAVPRFAAQMEGEAVRLARVVSDLLDLSRMEGEPGDRQAVRFDRLVAEEAARVGQLAREAGIDLTVTDPIGGPAMIRGSRRDLALLIRNLLENAIQYTRPGGTVAVGVEVVGSEATLTVMDTGIGIPSRDRSRVFERFYRVDRGRSRQTGGTGLGLSIVRHVAENHGGTVDLESALGTGSTFIVRIPMAVSTPTGRQAAPDPDPEATAAVEPVTETTGR